MRADPRIDEVSIRPLRDEVDRMRTEERFIEDEYLNEVPTSDDSDDSDIDPMSIGRGGSLASSDAVMDSGENDDEVITLDE